MISFVSLKAFGDLVIALTALRDTASAERSRVRILAGEHLAVLAGALDAPVRLDVLEGSGRHVPSLYNLRKDGLRTGLLDAARLKYLIHRSRHQEDLLVFDRKGAREMWLGGGRPVTYLPRASNIYQAYAEFLKVSGLAGPTAPRPLSRPGTRITGVFPSSRKEEKDLTLDILQGLLSDSHGHEAGVVIYVLEGERPDIERSGLPHQVLRRSFPDLRKVIADCRRVVSADSLPAHIAEHVGRPVFVIKPSPNTYWLPLSAFTSGRWATFGDLESGPPPSLDRFLSDT